MRDVGRIAGFIQLVAAFWYRHPDMRFFQLLSFMEDEVDRLNGHRCDTFYIEDDVTEAILKRLLQGGMSNEGQATDTLRCCSRQV